MAVGSNFRFSPLCHIDRMGDISLQVIWEIPRRCALSDALLRTSPENDRFIGSDSIESTSVSLPKL